MSKMQSRIQDQKVVKETQVYKTCCTVLLSEYILSNFSSKADLTSRPTSESSSKELIGPELDNIQCVHTQALQRFL